MYQAGFSAQHVEKSAPTFVTVASAVVERARPCLSYHPSTRFRVHQTDQVPLTRSAACISSRLPPRKLYTRRCSSPSFRMHQLVTMVTDPVSRLFSLVVAYLSFGTPLRRLFLPLLGRPAGLRGALLARVVMPAINSDMKDRALTAAAPAPEARVLELGFANGDLLQRLLGAGVHPPVFGLDVTPDMVALARARLGGRAVLGEIDVQDEKLVVDGVTYGQLFDEDDCVSAGLDPRAIVAPFDVVMFTNVFYFFSDTGVHVVARNLWTLVKDGGRIVTVAREAELDREALGAAGFRGNLSKARYIDAMREAGFEVNVDEGQEGELVTIVATKRER